MKKFILALLALFVCFGSLSAQNDRELKKQLKKEYKQKMKQLKKEKWQLFGSSRTIEVMLLQHYSQLNDPELEAVEVVGVASRFKSKNLGHQQAVNNACFTYAQSAGSSVKGRIVADLGGNADAAESEFDHFYAAYERSVEKEIKGEMKESFSLIRANGDGSYEMQTFFIVSENAATKARLRAYENAARESAAAQKYAEKISSFVREGVAPGSGE